MLGEGYQFRDRPALYKAAFSPEEDYIDLENTHSWDFKF
jgi:hypothetical protein